MIELILHNVSNATGAKLGAPDTGLISYAEMVDQGRYIHEATKSMPIIGDGDTGDHRLIGALC